MSEVKGEPILVRCEGSGCPPAGGSSYRYLSMCAMCGHVDLLLIDGLILEHTRDDIIARIDRGDFDG